MSILRSRPSILLSSTGTSGTALPGRHGQQLARVRNVTGARDAVQLEGLAEVRGGRGPGAPQDALVQLVQAVVEVLAVTQHLAEYGATAHVQDDRGRLGRELGGLHRVCVDNAYSQDNVLQ